MGFALSEMKVDCPGFLGGGPIPSDNTGEGDDDSPLMRWTDAPADTKAFAVVCHDPDAPLVSPSGTYGFVHWVLYNIPGDVTTLPEGTTAYTKGKNDFGKVGYGGPMPPQGHGPHHYYFWVLALDEALELEGGLTMWELFQQIEPHLIGMNRTIGMYERE